MTKLHLSLATIILTLVAGLADTSWGRGFGGFHGGGGMRMGGGGMRMGGFAGGGMRPGGSLGGIRPGGEFGGSRLGGANLAAQRPGSVGNFGAERPRTTSLGERGFPAGAAGGFSAERRDPGSLSGLHQPVARGVAERPNQGQLGSFLGMPSDGGLHAVAGNRRGIDQRGLTRYPDADLRRRGDDVRRGFRGGNYYSADWYRRYPGAWYPRRWAYGNVWAAATWDSMSGWFGYGDSQPVYYDYGNNVTYQDNSVYVNGQDMGTSDQYYQQAQTLASAGEQAQTTDDQQWMPLGVFAMTHDQQNKANLILQLAVNKEGIIRGNYTATITNDTKPVQGSVDKTTQRAAWTIGDNTENVIETGIYNLTKDEAPALVHFGEEKTEQWVLVRIKQPDDSSDTDASPDASASQP